MPQEVTRAAHEAIVQRDAIELQRQMRVVRDMGSAAFYRHPEAWSVLFDDAASRVSEAADLPRAESLVRQGRVAQARGDSAELRRITEQLWKLLPAAPEERRLGFESGLR